MCKHLSEISDLNAWEMAVGGDEANCPTIFGLHHLVDEAALCRPVSLAKKDCAPCVSHQGMQLKLCFLQFSALDLNTPS